MGPGPVATFQVHEHLRPKVINYKPFNNFKNIISYYEIRSAHSLFIFSCVIYMKTIRYLTSLGVILVEMDNGWQVVLTGLTFVFLT